MRKSISFGLMLIILFTSCSVMASALPVFPGAQGFGTETVAGRGGQIIKVTNLNDAGTGSLRACVTASGPRVCVFETSGTITLSGHLEITNPYLTIAGQTAPSPGIQITGGTLVIDGTHDILIQHLALRGCTSGDDTVRISLNNYNLVLDHLSIDSGGDDEIFSIKRYCHDITISNNIIGAGTRHYGFLLYPIDSLSLTKNLFVHNIERNPRGRTDTRFVMLNNVIYNAGPYESTLITADEDNPTAPSDITIEGNYYKDGPSATPSVSIKLSGTPTGTKIYVNDNVRMPGGSLYSLDGKEVSSRPIWWDGQTVLTSSQAYDHVLSHAGSRPAQRDSLDQRFIDEVKTGTGNYVSSIQLVDYAVNSRSFTVPSNPNADDDSDGYTNLEEVLHSFACQVEGPDSPSCDGGTIPTYSCSELGGSCCSSGQSCVGGSFQLSSDCASLCCVGGTCTTVSHFEQYIEVEDFTLNSVLQIGSDSLASSGEYLYPPTGSGITTTPSNEAQYSVNIPYAGEYYLWIKVYAPSKDNDAMYIGFNGNFDRVFPVDPGSYEWVRVEETHGSADYSHTLLAGTNIINIGHCEELARADLIFITNDASQLPYFEKYIEAEDGLINSVMQLGSDAFASNGYYVYSPSGVGETTSPVNEVEYGFNIPGAGDYYLWLRLYAPTDANDAMYIGFNGIFDRVFPVDPGAYEWVRVEQTHNSGDYSIPLSSINNTVQIGHGEELARADLIFITTDANMVPGTSSPTSNCATDLGGSCCTTGQTCEGGSFSASDDCGSLCCVSGTCTTPTTCHDADTSCDGCISMTELMTYIGRWKAADGVTMTQLMQAIGLWKQGC